MLGSLDLDRLVELVVRKHKNTLSILLPFGEISKTISEIIVVLDSIKPTISVDYVEVNGQKARIIVVSKNILDADVHHVAFGGIIASRLTSLTKIVYDKSFWATRIVNEYKIKVFEEGLSFLANIGELIQYAKIPYEYFPLRNLSTYMSFDSGLAQIVSGLYDELNDKLLSEMRKEYNSIAKDSRIRQYVLLEKEYIRLKKHSFNLQTAISSKTLKTLIEVITPITGYLLSVFLKDNQSSNGRVVQPIFKHPHAIIVLEEGRLALGDWKELLEDTKNELRKIGKHSLIDSAEIYEANGEKIVIKQYYTLAGLKWLLASIVASISKKFSVMPGDRQLNEYKATIELKKNGIPVRDIILIDPLSYVTVFEYVEGVNIWEVEDSVAPRIYALLGELLARIHSLEIVLGDTKPDNFIYNSSDGQVYVIDLEQSKKSGNVEERAWDVAMFVYFHSLRRITPSILKALKSFIDGYVSVAGWKTVFEASKARYLIPFTSIAPIQNLLKLNELLRG